jgi:hypothetical protein
MDVAEFRDAHADSDMARELILGRAKPSWRSRGVNQTTSACMALFAVGAA